MIKKIIRTLILIGVLTAILFIGRSKWIKFLDRPAAERFSHSSYRKAVDCFRKVLGVSPFAASHYALAESYFDEGLEAKAVEEYQKTLQMDKRFVQAYLDLVNLCLLRESYALARTLIQKAEAALPDNPDIKDLKKQVSSEYFIEAGVKKFEAGDRVKARELLNNALVADPNSAPIHFLIALTYDERQDFYRSEDYLKKTISLDPSFFLARSFLGDIYFGKGDFEAAVEQYQASLAINRDDPLVLNNLGLAYVHLERYGSAIPVLEKALAIVPNNLDIYRSLANVYRDYGLLDKAAAGFIKIIQMNPDDPNVYNDLGDIYRRQGRNPEALAQYQASIEHGKKLLSQGNRDPSILVALAYAFNGVQEFDKAKTLVEEAILVNPEDPKAYMTLADAYRGLRRSDAALIALDKAKQLSSKKYFYMDDAIAREKEHLAEQRR